MVTLLGFGSVVALCCWALSYLTAGLWPCCVPVTLAADVLWLHFLDRRNRCIAWRIAGAVEVVALIGSVVSAILPAWVPMLLYVSLMLYGLLGPLATAFPTNEETDNVWRAIDRHQHRLHPKRHPPGVHTEAVHMGCSHPLRECPDEAAFGS